MRRISLFLFLMCATAFNAAAQAPNTIATYAGGGVNGSTAVGAYMPQPWSVVRDSSGNTYIASPSLGNVYKVNTSGTLSVCAGTGILGLAGDGGPATSAQLDFPTGLALDSAGNLYIADTNNNRIRKVTASCGTITTVAGSGTEYNGAGYFGGYSGDGELATDALLNNPFGVTVDGAGNLYIADTQNQVIRFVNASTKVISTYAGTGNAGFSGDNGAATAATFRLPSSVSVDSTGNLFIADRNNCAIRKVDNTTQHIITTYAGIGGQCGFGGDGAAATAANLNTPRGVYVDAVGNVFIADTFNSRIRKVDNTTSHHISTVAGNGSFCATPSGCGDGGVATSATLNVPYYVFEDTAGNLLIADLGDMRVRLVSITGPAPAISNYAGGGSGGDGGQALSAMLGLPYIAGVDGSGNLLILDSQSARVQRVDATTHVMTTYAGNGVLAVPGTPSGDNGPATAASFIYPTGMTFDSNGNLYIVDLHAFVVRKIDVSTGIITTVAGNGQQCGAGGNPNQPPDCGDDSSATTASLQFPEGVAVDVSGNIYISDAGLNRIRVLQEGGDIEPYAGTGAAGYADGALSTAQFNGPLGMTFGPNELLYVADGGNNRIRVIDTEGQSVETFAFNGFPTYGGDGNDATNSSMYNPAQVAVDAAGNVFVSGGFDNVVRRIDVFDSSVMTVAGNIDNLDGGFSGDGGAPNLALLSNFGLTVDANENLYIADAGNNRIRKVPMVPVAAWTPATLTPFGTVLQGQDGGSQIISFTNTGLNDLVVNVQSVPADFSAFEGCTAAPQGECDVFVEFFPVAGGPTGNVGGNLVLTTNDPNNPTITFALSGTVATTSFPLTVTLAGPANAGTVFDATTFQIDCPSTCTANYATGAVVTLTAFANPGFAFTSWSTNCTPVTDDPTECTIAMNQAATVTATFSVGTGGGGSVVIVASFGPGTGTITSSPAGINCPTTCTFTFDTTVTSVVLTATPNTGSVFVGWADGFCTSQTGNTCTLNIFDGLTSTAVFSVPRQPFTKGDIFIGSGSGMIFEYSPAGAIVQVLPALSFSSFAEFGGGLEFNAAGTTLYAADLSNAISGDVETFSTNGTGPAAFGGGAAIGATSLRLDPSGNVFVGLAANLPGGNLLEYAAGDTNAPTASFYPAYYNNLGIRAFELAQDDTTIFYTDGGASIYSFNSALGLQNPDITDSLTGIYAGDLRQLPDSSLLVGDGDSVVQVNSTTGAIMKTYTIPGASLLLGVTLDPDGVDFWTNDSFVGNVYKINLASGNIVSQFNTGLGSTAFSELAGFGAMAIYGSPVSGGIDLDVSLAGAGTGSVSSNVGGIACPTTCTANYTAGQQVILTATPSGGSTFTGWSGNCTGTGTCTVTMNQAQAVTATFSTSVSFVFTYVAAGTGTGTVTSTPSGINCTQTCTADFASGTQVTLAETPASGSTFTGWSGACSGTGSCVVTMNSAETVTATFALSTFPLTVTPAGTGSGTVTSVPTGINCPGTCSFNFSNGQVVTLTAAPATGSTFAGWTGACGGTGTCQLTMNAAQNVTATFNTTTNLTLTVALNGTAFGSVSWSSSNFLCKDTTGVVTGTCSSSFPSGTVIPLAETPGSGSVFGGWSGGSCSGTANTCNVTLTANTTVTATFNNGTGTFALSVSPAAVSGGTGNGTGTVTSTPAGINCTLSNGQVATGSGACTFNFASGAIVNLTATAATGSTFANWTGGGCFGTTEPCANTMASLVAVTVTFNAVNFALTVSELGTGAGTVTSNPVGINCPTTCSFNYASGTPVTLTAAAGANSIFAGWSGQGCSGTAPCTVTVNAAETVTATFNPTSQLSVTEVGTGSGTVSSNPSGILCPSTCAAPFTTGSQVTLTATANSGSTFAGWSGAGCSGVGVCTVTMSAAESVQATFNPTVTTFALTVTKAGSGSGTVTSTPTGINCGTSCSANFNSGTQVTLSEAPTTGSTFAGWSGACTGTGTCTVTMSAAESVTATFNTTTTFALTVQIIQNALNAGTVTSNPAGINCPGICTDSFVAGTQVTLTATPNSGFTFAGWGGACAGTGTCVVTMNAAESVTATINVTTPPSDIRSALVPFVDDGSAPVTVTWNPAFADTNYTAVCTAETTISDFLLPVITSRTATSMTVIPTAGGATPGVVDCTAIPDSDTSDLRHNRTAFSDTPQTVTVTWSTAFPDTNYTVACTVENDQTNSSNEFTSVISDMEAGFVTVDNGQIPAGAMHCIAVPDTSTTAMAHSRVGLSGQAPTVTMPWNAAFSNTSYAAACSEVQFDQTSSDAAVAVDLGTKLTGSMAVVDEISSGSIHCIGFTAAQTLLSLAVTPNPGTVQAGSTLQFTATGNYSDGSTQNLTTTATWTSSNTSVATIGNTTGTQGLATGVQVGDPVTITATDGVLTATATLTVTAAPQFALTVTDAGTGGGTVTSNTGGINCGSGCTSTYNSGTVVTLTAAPFDGSVFAGFSSNCAPVNSTSCTITMSAAETVTATFNLPPPNFTLTVSLAQGSQASPGGTGTVTSQAGLSPAINCISGSTEECMGSYPSGTVVTLTATPASGSAFTGWSGACTGTGTCAVTMNAAESVTATFSTSTFTFTTGPGYTTTTTTTPGGNIVVGFTLSSTTPTTVDLGCTSSAPQFLSCLITPAEVSLTGNGPSQVAIVLTSYCQGSTPGMPDGPTPGLPGGIVGVTLLGLALCITAWSYRGRRRLGLSFALLLFAAVGGAACGNLPKGTAGATPPGNYTLTVTATVAGQAPQAVQLTVVVQ